MFVQRMLMLGGWVCLMVGFAVMPLAAGAQNATAEVRFVQAMPAQPTITIDVDGRAVLPAQTFGTISPYLAIAAGTHALSARAANATAASWTAQPSFGAGGAYTVAALGFDDTAQQVYEDDRTVVPGKARVRVIHLSPDAPSADVEVVDGPTLVRDLAFPDASPYLTVEPGTYDLRVVAVDDNAVFLDLPDTSLKADTVYDVIAMGRLANLSVAVATYQLSAAPAERPASQMPATGSSGLGFGLIAWATLLLASGAMMRRRAATIVS